MQMLVKDIVKACNGVLLCGDPETVITSVETDSRLIEPGALFVQIPPNIFSKHSINDHSLLEHKSIHLGRILPIVGFMWSKRKMHCSKLPLFIATNFKCRW